MVLYSPYYAPTNILSRLLIRLTPSSTATTEPSLNLIEIAAYEGVAIGLAKELMEEIERLRPPDDAPKEVLRLMRDDQAGQESGGVRWYRDLIASCRIEDF